MNQKEEFKYIYKTPKNFSNLVLISDGEYLTGLFFESSKDESKFKDIVYKNDPSKFVETISWLDIYFSGKEPNFIPKYKINNLTSFRNDVTNEMLKIKYGKTMTYGDISNNLAKKYNIKKMSAQAVGGAIGANPICIIIPCHRVIGKNEKLIGYGGGINNKIELLRLEGIDISKFSM
jgi:methylated-DNA-[protein]-cysteine S-methyltransferase